jgi:methylmalonyl-CoA/ethylmalonyl-CoA epimerase
LDLSLHHVGLLVKDIEKRAKFYTQRLGYEIRSDVVHDPVQTAFVQFLKLPADSSYLELISPDGPQSKLANALGKGQALNHICYATADIEAQFSELRANGLFAVAAPVPGVAFGGRKIAWLAGSDRMLMELVERGQPGQL